MAGIDLGRPAIPPPRNQKSNFTNPQNDATLIYATLGLALATVTLFAWFRFLVKLLIMDKLHWEDYLIPFAWAAAIAQIVCGFMMSSLAPIIHSWDLTLRDFGPFLLWFRISAIFYNIGIVLIKVAMLIQVLRIFVPRGTRSKTFYAIHSLIWLNLTYYIIIVFLMFFNCKPLDKAWKPWLPGKCIEIGRVAMATATVNLIGDIAILFVTQRAIWKLMKIDRFARVKLAVVFMAGIVPCGFAVMCLVYNDRQLRGYDFVRDSMYMSIACYGEVASGMFVLFLPVVPKFFSHLRLSSSLSSFSHRHRKQPSALSFSDVGLASRAEGKKRSLFHISYTQGEGSAEGLANHAQGEEGVVLAGEGRDGAGGWGINVTSEVSVRSERIEVGNEDDVEMVRMGRAGGERV